MIQVSREPAPMTFFCLESCCLCRCPTSFWYVPKGVACCQACAERATEEDLPSKAEWFKRELIEGRFES